MNSLLKSIVKFILRPVFPAAFRYTTLQDGQASSQLFLAHMSAGLFVVVGVLSAEKSSGDTLQMSKLIVLTICVTFGILSALSLLIQRCRQRLLAQRTCTEEDPSLNLQLGFLWLFGLANITFLCLHIISYQKCVRRADDNIEVHLFVLITNILQVLFIVLEIAVLTYKRGGQLEPTIHLHFSIACILATNFSIWYDSTMHKITVYKNSTEIYDKSCLHRSEIQEKLEKIVSPIFLPPKLEFCILASTLLVSLWQNSKKFQNLDQDSSYTAMTSDSFESQGVEHTEVNGIFILAMIVGIVINLPIFISVALMNFVYDSRNKEVNVAYGTSVIISALCTCVIVCICNYKLKKNFTYTKKPMILREYILIFSLTGIMAYYTYALLAGISGNTPTKLSIPTSLLSMLDIYLQTWLFIYSRRFAVGLDRLQLLSACAIILVTTNLTFWFINSYNSYSLLAYSRHKGFTDLGNMKIILVSMTIYFRFFSGMSAYCMYKRFKLRIHVP